MNNTVVAQFEILRRCFAGECLAPGGPRAQVLQLNVHFPTIDVQRRSTEIHGATEPANKRPGFCRHLRWSQLVKDGKWQLPELQMGRSGIAGTQLPL